MSSPDGAVKIYDFRRPDKFSRDQIHTLAKLHESFARLATVTLSAELRSLATVHLSLVDQLNYAEVTASIANPTTLAIGSMYPLKGSALLEIPPAITFSLLDRLFGGPGDGRGMTRDLTEIEQATMENLLVRLWTNLGTAWGLVLDLRPQLTQLEVNPMFAQIVPPHEMVVLVAFDVKIGAVSGQMNLVIPYLTIEPVLPRLSSEFWYSHKAHESTAEDRNRIERTMAGLPVTAEVLVEGEPLSLRALGALKKGSLVLLPGAGRGEAFLRVGGRPLFRLKGEPGRRSTYAVEDGPAESLPSRSADSGGAAPGVQKALEDLRTGFESTVSRIAGGLDALQRQQDVLSDLLSLPSQDPLRPFSFLAAADPSDIAGLFVSEQPQLIALVLAHIDAPQAAVVLGKLAPEVQPEVVRRIAALDPSSAEVVATVEKVLKRKHEMVAAGSLWGRGGLDHVVQILSAVNRSTEAHVVETLGRTDAALAGEIRGRLLAFEDLVTLERSFVETTLGEVDPDVLARALTVTDETVKEFVVACLPAARRKAFTAKVQALGRLPWKEVEAAQRQIVGALRGG